MDTSTNEKLLSLVKDGPAFIAGNADDASIQQRIEALRAKSNEPARKESSCNMGWGWGN